jgi:3-methyl-2-oxobutanoate hydroxymethyltransferase
VITDTFGLSDFIPKHAKQYAKLIDIMTTALTEYQEEVKAGKFPTEKHSYIIDKDVIDELKAM